MNESTFKWGTVTSVSPLRVKLDGDTVALPVKPSLLVSPAALAVGDRVRCELANRRLIVYGLRDDGDTGWVDVAPYFLEATSADIKRVGSTGMLRATVGVDIPTGTSSMDVTSTPLPIEWRSPHNMFGAAFAVGGVSATAFFRSNGTVAISNRNAIALTGNISFSIPIMY